jgi:hypothetical protein
VIRQDLIANNAQCKIYKLVVHYKTYLWRFPEGTFDLVISSMNDLPRLLTEVKVGSSFVL